MNQTTTAANPLGYERIGKLLRSYAIPSIISLIPSTLSIIWLTRFLSARE